MMGPDRRAARRGSAWALGVALSVAAVSGAPASMGAQSASPRAGYAWADVARWRFRHPERRTKAVVLAGSIGAHPNRPYARLLHEWCPATEVQNLSQVGRGAPALYRSFRRRVLRNPRVPIGAPDTELWVIWGGGLNSVATPHRNARALHDLTRTAHRRGIGVVALTLTPWGEDDVMSGGQGAHLARSTRLVVDDVLGRLTPDQALGQAAAQRRPGVDWEPAEQPDVVVDLYDSRLRDPEAPVREVTRIEARLQRDRRWRRRAGRLPEQDRKTRLAEDARLLAEMPRWYLRPRYRGFDHVHLNADGHRVVADTVCPRLPASWGCTCPPPHGAGAEAP